MDRANELIIDIPDGAQLSARDLARAKILKNGISSAHEAFADYMLINPGCTYAEMKAVFGYSVAWICTVVNSDMFRAYYAERRAGIVVSIAEDLPARLAAAAALATEKIIGVLEKTEDPDTVIDAFDKILMRNGYAPNAKGSAPQQVVNNTQNNVFYLEKGDLAAAREKLTQAHAPRELEVKGEQIAASAGAAMPAT